MQDAAKGALEEEHDGTRAMIRIDGGGAYGFGRVRQLHDARLVQGEDPLRGSGGLRFELAQSAEFRTTSDSLMPNLSNSSNFVTSEQ